MGEGRRQKEGAKGVGNGSKYGAGKRKGLLRSFWESSDGVTLFTPADV